MRIIEIVVSGLGGSSIGLKVSSLGGVSIGGTSDGSGVPSRSAWSALSLSSASRCAMRGIELWLVGGDQPGAAKACQRPELRRALGHLESVGDGAVRSGLVLLTSAGWRGRGRRDGRRGRVCRLLAAGEQRREGARQRA